MLWGSISSPNVAEFRDKVTPLEKEMKFIGNHITCRYRTCNQITFNIHSNIIEIYLVLQILVHVKIVHEL